MTTSDAERDKAAQRSYWADKAPMWDRHADEMAKPADRMNQPFLDAVGIEAGQRVLDLASGAGEPALGIARRVGPTGAVVAGFDRASERELRFSLRVPARLPAGQPFWLAQADMSLGHCLDAADEDTRRAFHDAVAEGLAPHLDGGEYQLYVHARIGLGTAPAA